MNKQLQLAKEFHEKFNQPVLLKPALIPEDRYALRHGLMLEEVHEYLEGNEKKDLINIAKELADIMYSLQGTILEHGLQDIFEDVFAEVHSSHMTKDINEHKMTKGENFKEADIKKVFNAHKENK